MLTGLTVLTGLVGLAVLTGLTALTGCAQHSDPEEEPPAPQQQTEVPIGFRAAMAPVAVTRAGGGQIDNELLREKGFGVYCWYTGQTPVALNNRNGTLVATTDPTGTTPVAHISEYTQFVLLNNQQVVWDAVSPHPSWTYTPAKYWPLNPGDMLTLRAYAPYSSYMMTDDDTGMPLLPVVVSEQDYRNDTQHDPLWGTGRLVNTETGEYYHPGTDPENVPTAESQRYGHLYNNITYEMSGSNRLSTTTPADERNGIIDWYFHHGMASLMFTIAITNDPGCDEVVITGIEITPLYEGALLSLDSPTAASTEKPVWRDGYGDMTVALTEGTPATEAGDLAPIPTPVPEPADFNPYPFVIDTRGGETDALPLLSKGLLIIPRDLRSEGMTISVTYYVDGESSDKMRATATVKQNFQGNTAYTLGLKLEPDTKGLEISLVQSAFTTWEEGYEVSHKVYNW